MFSHCQLQVEGKGNGIKTVIVNMVDVAKALNRPPTCKFVFIIGYIITLIFSVVFYYGTMMYIFFSLLFPQIQLSILAVSWGHRLSLMLRMTATS